MLRCCRNGCPQVPVQRVDRHRETYIYCQEHYDEFLVNEEERKVTEYLHALTYPKVVAFA